MNDWIAVRIESAGWRRFLFWLVFYIAYSVWAFIAPGPWTRVLAALGVRPENIQTAALPELMFGFHDDMPLRTLNLLGAASGDYALFQAVDIPYAALGVAMTIAGIAIGLKRFDLGGSPFRYALLVPVIYLLAELIENPLLAAMALGFAPAEGAAATVQQMATSVKFITDGAGSAALFIAVIASFLAFATKPLRRKRAA